MLALSKKGIKICSDEKFFQNRNIDDVLTIHYIDITEDDNKPNVVTDM